MSRRKPRPNMKGPVQGRRGAPKPPRDGTKPSLNRYNVYKCAACGISWRTVDLDEGVTPMFSRCYGTEGCQGTASSMGYPEGPPPNLPLMIEWYRPMHTDGLSHELKLHIYKGGLMSRASMIAPAWVKRIA